MPSLGGSGEYGGDDPTGGYNDRSGASESGNWLSSAWGAIGDWFSEHFKPAWGRETTPAMQERPQAPEAPHGAFQSRQELSDWLDQSVAAVTNPPQAAPGMKDHLKAGDLLIHTPTNTVVGVKGPLGGYMTTAQGWHWDQSNPGNPMLGIDDPGHPSYGAYKAAKAQDQELAQANINAYLDKIKERVYRSGQQYLEQGVTPGTYGEMVGSTMDNVKEAIRQGDFSPESWGDLMSEDELRGFEQSISAVNDPWDTLTAGMTRATGLDFGGFSLPEDAQARLKEGGWVDENGNVQTGRFMRGIAAMPAMMTAFALPGNIVGSGLPDMIADKMGAAMTGLGVREQSTSFMGDLFGAAQDFKTAGYGPGSGYDYAKQGRELSFGKNNEAEGFNELSAFSFPDLSRFFDQLTRIGVSLQQLIAMSPEELFQLVNS